MCQVVRERALDVCVERQLVTLQKPYRILAVREDQHRTLLVTLETKDGSAEERPLLSPLTNTPPAGHAGEYLGHAYGRHFFFEVVHKAA